MPISPSLVRRTATVAGVAGASLGAVSAAGSLGAATYFARVLVTPERVRPDNVVVHEATGEHVVIGLTEDTVIPGRFGLWFAGGAGHARLGDILDVDAELGRVTRRLVQVERGVLRPGPARWSSYYFPFGPQEALGLPTESVTLPGEVGELQAWVVPGAGEGPQPGRRWAVHVHGRGGTREECLRALPLMHRLGLTSLVPTYRNDPDGPPSPDGRYNLGLSEWRDIEAAMRYALARGARDLVLVGWSMGGAIVLQTLDLSPLSRHVSAVVLDSPVIDWGDVIDHHARLRRIPGGLAVLVEGLIGSRWAHRLAGVHERLDVARTNWQHRAEELHHPICLLHSADDEFVPVGPSRELARRRPDLVRYEEWSRARHVQEWNTDPERWEDVVGGFLTEIADAPASGRPPAT